MDAVQKSDKHWKYRQKLLMRYEFRLVVRRVMSSTQTHRCHKKKYLTEIQFLFSTLRTLFPKGKAILKVSV